MSLWQKRTQAEVKPARRISLSTATQKLCAERLSSDLTFRWKRATIQTLPGIAAKHRESTGALLYDHMFDHNRLRRTRKQRRKERRRASFPERKGSNGFHAHVTPGSSPFGTKRPWVQVPQPGPERNGDFRQKIVVSFWFSSLFVFHFFLLSNRRFLRKDEREKNVALHRKASIHMRQSL